MDKQIVIRCRVKERWFQDSIDDAIYNLTITNQTTINDLYMLLSQICHRRISHDMWKFDLHGQRLNCRKKVIDLINPQTDVISCSIYLDPMPCICQTVQEDYCCICFEQTELIRHNGCRHVCVCYKCAIKNKFKCPLCYVLIGTWIQKKGHPYFWVSVFKDQLIEYAKQRNAPMSHIEELFANVDKSNYVAMMRVFEETLNFIEIYHDLSL